MQDVSAMRGMQGLVRKDQMTAPVRRAIGPQV